MDRVDLTARETEDVTPTFSLPSEEDGAMEARFAHTCKNELALDESTTKRATALFVKCKRHSLECISDIEKRSPELVERLWSAFAVYCTKRLSQERGKERENGGITLCRILRAFKLTVIAFFKTLAQLLLKADYILRGLYGSDWEKRLELMELQSNFIHLTLLSRYYRRVYLDFFVDETGSSGSSGYISDYHRFGWLLFLALRTHAFSRFKDLVTCANGLVSILAVLILHVPVLSRTFDIQDSKFLTVKSDEGVNLLASLSNMYQTSEDELRTIVEKITNLLTDILKKQPSPASNFKSENLDYIITDDLVYFKDLLNESSLQSSLLILEDDYDDTIHLRGELDERIFINEGDGFLGTKNYEGAINMSTRKLEPNPNASQAMLPTTSSTPHINENTCGNRPVVGNTTVSTAMTNAKWLWDVISPLPSNPSAGLKCFLSSCDRDLTVDVFRRAYIILGAVFPSSTAEEGSIDERLKCANLMDNIWAEQRKLEALKLYYRVLEAICREESRILHSKNLISLLTNERFHRCMLACSAELVLTTLKAINLTFPVFLEKVEVTNFDLGKIIGSFIRHEETLPRELKQHLNTMEERLLESTAWEKGSTMYNSLIVARPDLSAEINRLGLLAEPLSSLDDLAMQYNISTGDLPPLPTRKREPTPAIDQNGEPRTPKKQCNRRNVLMKQNSFTFKSNLIPLQFAFARPTQPNPVREGETYAVTEINVFFNKILKLAAVRIKGLCERLQFSRQIMQRIYHLIQLIIHHRTALFFNRNIDQLILCSLYVIAKISYLNLTFKEISYHYKKQPYSKSSVLRSVFVSWSSIRNAKVGEDHIDIITFYNKVFVPSVKPLLVVLATRKGAQEDNRPAEDMSSKKDQSPSKDLTASNNRLNSSDLVSDSEVAVTLDHPNDN